MVLQVRGGRLPRIWRTHQVPVDAGEFVSSTDTHALKQRQAFFDKGKIIFRIASIPPTAFQDLHSLEWIKLYNNKLTTLHYELMEPVLDTLIHIDLHSETITISNGRLAKNCF